MAEEKKDKDILQQVTYVTENKDVEPFIK